MNVEWENTFTLWAKPPGSTETDRCENAIRSVRNAVSKSERLKNRKTEVFVHGSYRNNVNVREDSDIDVGVLCTDCFFPDYPPGKTGADYGNVDSSYSYRQFKDELEVALVAYFGRSSVIRGNKAFDIRENSYHVEADVSPFMEYKKYFADGSLRCGVGLLPDNGLLIKNYPERLVESWPETNQHYENGVKKNEATGRCFKSVVRILKVLRNEMDTAGIGAAKNISGFLIECLTWNVANSYFGQPSWDKEVQGVLAHLWMVTKEGSACKDWCEVNGIKYLFHPTQKWTIPQVNDFVDKAWRFIGVRS